MKYDFDKEIIRRGSNSYKWDMPEEDGVLPMWVADMDFEVAPCITASSATPWCRKATTRPSCDGSLIDTVGISNATGYSIPQALYLP